GLVPARPRWFLRSGFHHLPPLRRRLPQHSLDAGLPRVRDAEHGPARSRFSLHSDGHRLRSLGRHRSPGDGDRRHPLVSGAGLDGSHPPHLRSRGLHRGPEAHCM
ncbi:MAG: small multidrug resistance family (SMR) protein, partial [uncultured Sphingosinicella sp.]